MQVHSKIIQISLLRIFFQVYFQKEIIEVHTLTIEHGISFKRLDQQELNTKPLKITSFSLVRKKDNLRNKEWY